MNPPIGRGLSGFTAALLLALLVATAVSVGPEAEPAWAFSNSSHCYTLAQLGIVSTASGFNGDDVTLRSNCLTAANASTEFVTNETWVLFSGGTYWTEAGMAYGNPAGARRYFFWADNRPGGGYHEHDAGSGPALNSYYIADIDYIGGGSYTVQSGGFTGTSTSQAHPSNGLQTGTETNSNNGTVFGSSSSLSYYTLQNAGHAGWTYSGGGSTLYSAPSGYGSESWVSVNSGMRDGNTTC